MTGFLKLNINCASKGNPRTAGFGGVLRNEEGIIICIFHGHLGKATNNMAKLMALEQGLEFLKQGNCLNVISEVDSDFAIDSVKRISYGTEPEKVSKHWRLIRVFQRIQSHLLVLCTISFNHMRRKAFKLADILANQGVSCKEDNAWRKWQELPQSRLKALCSEQATEDMDIFGNRSKEKWTQ